LIVDQLRFVFSCIFNLQLRDRRLADRLSTEPTLCQFDYRSDRRSEAMFLARISNELQIATFNRQLCDLISQYLVINLMGDSTDD